MKLIAGVLAALSIAAFHVPSTSATGCSYYSCSTCTGASGCGWAADSSLCLAGNSTGPNYPYTSTNWDYYSSQCPGTCPTTDYCSTCTSYGGCGWDGMTCRSGTAFGPTSGSASSWTYYTSSCGCSSYTSCSGCIAASGCGWDGVAGSCKTGSSIGPTVGSTTAWYYSSCPCSVSTNCAACTYQSFCGWDGSLCRAGTSAGPNTGTSTGTWYYGSCVNWSGAVSAAFALAAWLLIVVIVVPLVICICVIACIVYHCCIKQPATVVIQQPLATPLTGGQMMMQPGYAQPQPGYAQPQPMMAPYGQPGYAKAQPAYANNGAGLL